MDSNRFDGITRRFANRTSRRSIVRGVAVGGAAMATMRAASPVLAAPQSKVDICHFDADSGTYHMINVSGNALNAHLAHGDYIPGEVLASFSMAATNPSPVDSGVFLADGSSVDVSITGIAGWCCNLQLDANGSAPCGFEGIPFNCGSVVGVIGGGDIFSDYTPFFEVGTGPTTVTASGTSGDLVLQYVDGCQGCYGDNNGELFVTITRPSC